MRKPLSARSESLCEPWASVARHSANRARFAASSSFIPALPPLLLWKSRAKSLAAGRTEAGAIGRLRQGRAEAGTVGRAVGRLRKSDLDGRTPRAGVSSDRWEHREGRSAAEVALVTAIAVAVMRNEAEPLRARTAAAAASRVRANDASAVLALPQVEAKASLEPREPLERPDAPVAAAAETSSFEDVVVALTGPAVARAPRVIGVAAVRGPAEVRVGRHAPLNNGPRLVANGPVLGAPPRPPLPPIGGVVPALGALDGVVLNETRAANTVSPPPAFHEAVVAASRLGTRPAKRLAAVRTRQADPRPAVRRRPRSRKTSAQRGVPAPADVVAPRPEAAVVRPLLTRVVLVTEETVVANK